LTILVPVAASALQPAVKLNDVPLDARRSRIVATVQGAAPVTITFQTKPDSENCAAQALTRVVSQPGDVVVTELHPADPSKPWKCEWHFATHFGDSTRPEPEACELSLPFRPEGRFLVTQGFDGPFTHRERVQHAIDFEMPEGTPVLAARDGVVTAVLDDDQDNTRLGGNAVVLLHPDGTLTQYAHLKRASVVVREGQKIRRGAVLASSGSTNLTPVGPHLHFETFLEPGPGRHTIPFKVRLGDGTCRVPSAGETF
jgi:murein DD-endopeptidase MepM/ murein hydrolase activator NlpD